MINKNGEKQKIPRLFELWEQIINGTEQENKKEDKEK